MMMSKIESLKDVKNQRGYLEYSRDVTQKHSPASRKLLDLVIHHFEWTFEKTEKGKKAIWTSARCIPVIYSLGITPLIVLDIVRYGESEVIEEAESDFQIPVDVCCMIKAEFGGLKKYKNRGIDRVAITPLFRCEPEMLCPTLLENEGYESYIIDIPQAPSRLNEKRRKQIEKLYREEYLRFAKWLSDEEIDKEKLHNELVRANRVRDKVLHLQELQNKHNCYLGTVASMLVRCGVEAYYGHPDLFEEICDELLLEFEQLKEGEYHDDTKAKIVWSGARGVDFSAFIAVDQSHAHVEAWNLICKLEDRYDLDIDPFEAVIKYDYSENSGRNSGGIDVSEDVRLIKQTNAGGLVLFQTQGCSFYSVAYELRRKKIGESGFPVLLLIGTTQDGEVNGQMRMRLGAFVEMFRK